MSFDCPKCGAVGVGVLLFNLVAPCDKCKGISLKRKQRYTSCTQGELASGWPVGAKRIYFFMPSDYAEIVKRTNDGTAKGRYHIEYWLSNDENYFNLNKAYITQNCNDEPCIIDWGE